PSGAGGHARKEFARKTPPTAMLTRPSKTRPAPQPVRWRLVGRSVSSAAAPPARAVMNTRLERKMLVRMMPYRRRTAPANVADPRPLRKVTPEGGGVHCQGVEKRPYIHDESS